MKFSIFFFVALTLFSTMANDNLIPNPQFKQTAGKLSDWRFTGAVPAENWRVTDDGNGKNCMELSDDAPGVKVYSLMTMLPIDPFKSYEFSCDVKTENIHNLTIFHRWWTKDGKRPPERIIKRFNGTSGWTTVTAVLTAADAANTDRLSLSFGVYPDPSGKTRGKAWIRNPVLRVASEDTRPAAARPAAKVPDELSIHSFPSGLTAQPPLQEYMANRGEVEFFGLRTSHPYRKPAHIYVSLPRGVEAELYMRKIASGKSELVETAAETVEADKLIRKYELDASYEYIAWSNGLLFKTGADTPEHFKAVVRITSPEGKILVEMSAPVRVIEPVKMDEAEIPGFKSFSWVLAPPSNIDLDNPRNKLAIELMRRWRETGFSDTRAANIDNFPYFLTKYLDKESRTLKAAQTFSGAPARNICHSSALAHGVDFLEGWLRQKKSFAILQQPDFWGVIDYEPYFSWTTSICFCPECRQAFMKYAKLDGETLSAKEILEKHQPEWTRFITRQRTDILRVVYAAIKRINPQSTIALCTMPQAGHDDDESFLKEYGIDLRLYDDFVDQHCPMNYSTTLKFFTRLEGTAAAVKKPHIPILASGWGPTTNFNPFRYGLQVKAAGIIGCPAVYVYRGLFEMSGEWLNEHRRALLVLKQLTPYRLEAENVFYPEREKYYENGYGAAGNLFGMVKTLGGKTGVFLFNNHQSETVFAKVKFPEAKSSCSLRNLLDGTLFSPDGVRKAYSAAELRNGITVKLAPFEMLPVEIAMTGTDDGTISVNTNRLLEEENRLKQIAGQRYQAQNKHGMQTGLTNINGRSCFSIRTPAQTLEIDLGAGAVGKWSAGEKGVASRIGNDSFVAPIPFWLNQQNADLTQCTFEKDKVITTFRFKLVEPRYAGLAIEKTYAVYRDVPKIDVQINVLPEGGYRQFTYRANLVLSIGMTQLNQSYASEIEYQIPRNGEWAAFSGPLPQKKYMRIFVRPDAVFYPGGEPYFLQQAQKESFSGDSWMAKHRLTGEAVKAVTGSSPEELAAWVYGAVATMEWIYPSAYPDDDPHKVSDWKINYSLEYLPSN